MGVLKLKTGNETSLRARNYFIEMYFNIGVQGVLFVLLFNCF